MTLFRKWAIAFKISFGHSFSNVKKFVAGDNGFIEGDQLGHLHY
jgi:hypothetical protein